MSNSILKGTIERHAVEAFGWVAWATGEGLVALTRRVSRHETNLEIDEELTSDDKDTKQTAMQTALDA